MGNSSTKEARTSTSSERSNARQHSASGGPSSFFQSELGDRPAIHHGSRGSRGSRHEIPFLNLVGGPDRDPAAEPRKETRQEREARRAEKERVARAKERERSIKEEGVDGGYLVTLGTYVGPEDYSKATVRQLMIERRLAPFWRGLNEHSDSWTEHQLVAAARGRPIPAPDEIPPEEPSPTEFEAADTSSKPITFRSQFSSSNNATHLSVSHPMFSGPNNSPGTTFPSQSPLFRGRSKTLASLASSRSGSQPEITPQEMRLPHEPQINGQPVEANLYKDVIECPICFLYYPPYLNKTRCCDQPICSECFVQIKRPDPHPPEHTDPNAPPQPEPPVFEEEGQLISEPAACPFCVQNEFGVTYEPPPFRRGLVYPNTGNSSSFGRASSAMSSQTSLANSTNGSATPSGTGPVQRRRTQSLSATAPTVITTDRVRPDWAKKLSDARAQAARRSAAATALHTAAYMMGASPESRFAALGRRRRYISSETGNAVEGDGPRGAESMGMANVEAFLAAIEGAGPSRSQVRGSGDLFPGRMSSRGNRADDLEELMVMEAIRQSLAAEEERKKKQEKEAKKEEKKRTKEQKKAEKTARKNGLYSSSANASSSFHSPAPSPTLASDPAAVNGKGKGKAPEGTVPTSGYTAVGFNPLSEPTSTLNDAGKSFKEDPQDDFDQTDTMLGPSAASAGRSDAASTGQQTSTRQRAVSELSSSTVSSAHSGAPDLPDRGNLPPSDTSGRSHPLDDPGSTVARQTDPDQDSVISGNGTGSAASEPSRNFGSLAAMVGLQSNEESAVSDSSTSHVLLNSTIAPASGGDGSSAKSNSVRPTA